MAYFVALVSVWFLFSAATALRPGRRGVFKVLALPVGWAAAELAAQAFVTEAALVALLWWWGWPRTHWLSVLVVTLAALVLFANLVLVALLFNARRVVRRALSQAPLRPLESPRAREDRFGTWWRTALQIPWHPRHLQLLTDVAYGPHPRHRLDLWRNSTTPLGAPVILYVHGGSWTFGDKHDQGRPMLHEFVERGWIAVPCNYRLAPGSPWPAQIEDVTRALGWIKKNIATHGGDPDRVVVAGGSAGGQLAALLALTTNDPTWRPRDVGGVTDWSVRGCLSFYGVLEMTGDARHWNGRGGGLLHLLEHKVVQEPFVANESLYWALSPLYRIHVGAPAFLVVQGRNDTLVDVTVARAFRDEFRRHALAPLYYVELPFTQHAFDLTASPRTSATTRAALAFATSVTWPRPQPSRAALANYEVPPSELRVEVTEGQWRSARDAVRPLGPYFVVTADNPHGERLERWQNEQRRRELQAQLVQHGVDTRATISRDRTGRWPDEDGFALLNQSVAFARALARTFDQFAFYEVGVDGVGVRRTSDGDDGAPTR